MHRRSLILLAAVVVWATQLAVGPVAAAPRAEELAFSTYLGSLGDELATGVAVDANGFVYVVGQTDSTGFPVVHGVQSTLGGGSDAFVAKFSPDGSSLVWSTYLGGAGDDVGTGIAVDAAGCAYVTGQTYSKNFPTTPGAFDDDNGRMLNCEGADCLDSFVTKFTADGASLAYSTYLGGEHDDYAYGIAVDASGHAFITGATNSFGFPRVNAFDPVKRQGTEAFITKMGVDGTTVVYSSYIGGNRGDAGFAVGVDSAGNAIVAGDTLSTDFVTKDAFQASNASTNDAVDAFVTKVDPTGVLLASSYLGGAGRDLARSVAVDATGAVYVAGETTSANFPVVSGAQATLGGGVDAFVAKVRPDGTGLEVSTYVGGVRDERVAGIVTTATGAALVGSTTSADFPTVDAFQAACGGCAAPGFFADAFVTVLAEGGARFETSTFLGGAAEDEALGVAVDADGGVVVAGLTHSADFPTTPDAFQAVCPCSTGNTLSGFVVRFAGVPPVADAPAISRVTIEKRPFRVVVDGERFAAGAAVFIGDDATAWSPAVVEGSTRITLGGGKTLKAKFPKGVAVTLRVVNPDGGAATASLTR